MHLKGRRSRAAASAVGRAAAKLASARAPIRGAALAWLEATAARREPEHLELRGPGDLAAVLSAARAAAGTAEVCDRKAPFCSALFVPRSLSSSGSLGGLVLCCLPRAQRSGRRRCVATHPLCHHSIRSQEVPGIQLRQSSDLAAVLSAAWQSGRPRCATTNNLVPPFLLSSEACLKNQPTCG